MSKQVIEEFKRSWEFIRGMTLDFIECVPADQWEFSPDDECSPLNKQFRHLVWVSGLYNASLRDRKTDLSKKKTFYAGSLIKSDLIQGLKDADAELNRILDSLGKSDIAQFRVDHFGMQMGFTEFTHVMIQHESIHQGLWSLYAKKAGFKTPKSWKENWEL